jgi:FG-GAP-like repeat
MAAGMSVLAEVSNAVGIGYYLYKIFGPSLQINPAQLTQDIVNQVSTIIGKYYVANLTVNAKGALDALNGNITSYCGDVADQDATPTDLGGPVANNLTLQNAITEANDLYSAWTGSPPVTPQQMQQMVSLYLNLGVAIAGVCQELNRLFAAENDASDATDALNCAITQVCQFATNGAAALSTTLNSRPTFVTQNLSYSEEPSPHNTQGPSTTTAYITDTWPDPEVQGGWNVGSDTGDTLETNGENYLTDNWPNVVSTYQNGFKAPNNVFVSSPADYTNLETQVNNQLASYKNTPLSYYKGDPSGLATQISSFQSWYAGCMATTFGLLTLLPPVVTTFGCETDGTWTMGNYQGGGIPNLIFIKNNPSEKNYPLSSPTQANIEVHIASGPFSNPPGVVQGYQTRIFEMVTTFACESDGIWTMGNYDGDDILDLIFIKTSNTQSNMVEVHINSGSSNYQTRILDAATNFPISLANYGTFLMADWNGDGYLDLIFIETSNTQSNMVEVHINSGAPSSNYQTRMNDYATAFGYESDGTWTMANYDGDSILDLIFIKTGNTQSGMVEVHINSGASNYQTPILNAVTNFPTSNATNGTWVMPALSLNPIFIQTSNTTSGQVEVVSVATPPPPQS